MNSSDEDEWDDDFSDDDFEIVKLKKAAVKFKAVVKFKVVFVFVLVLVVKVESEDEEIELMFFVECLVLRGGVVLSKFVVVKSASAFNMFFINVVVDDVVIFKLVFVKKLVVLKCVFVKKVVVVFDFEEDFGGESDFEVVVSVASRSIVRSARVRMAKIYVVDDFDDFEDDVLEEDDDDDDESDFFEFE